MEKSGRSIWSIYELFINPYRNNYYYLAVCKKEKDEGEGEGTIVVKGTSPSMYIKHTGASFFFSEIID